jgi:hypothetical protein
MDPKDFHDLEEKNLFFFNIHYQGGSKSYMEYDLCRILLLTNNGIILKNEIKEVCEKIKKDDKNFPDCKDHYSHLDKQICVRRKK